ncbi:MAG: dTDP-4-dehydrorhamnose reductase [Clostridia bacterium]|jgi:dTDP-4-dehydrorhamnose reductase|nr:dTDP-4-dehydrorhamnose reductase [Clostridia bacterium]
MKILITGANGMLAKAVKEELKEYELILTDLGDLDITNLEQVKEFVKKNNPQYIINCAAYTAVDKAEEEKEIAKKVNGQGPKNLAIAANEENITLVHISTDYVFDGDKPINEPYIEDENKKPVTVYGITKLEGEQNIVNNCKKYYIFRTAWLYGEGNNFVRTMIKLGKEKEEINVVSDQYGSPTYAVDLASIIHQAIDKKIPYGVYHATNEGYTNWYEFTKDIFEICNINCKVKPVKTEEFPRPAKRPKNSKLSKEKLINEGIVIPEYMNALKRYLKEENS